MFCVLGTTGAPLRKGAIGWTSPPAFGSSLPIRRLRFPALGAGKIYHIVVLGTTDGARSEEKEYPVKTWSALMDKPFRSCAGRRVRRAEIEA
jgi:hypothetical protein